MSNIIRYFSFYLAALSASEKHVLYFIDTLPNIQYKQLKLQQLAEDAHVSTTTVIRMCHKLQFTGFSEFKFFISKTEREDNRQNTIQQCARQVVTTKNIQQYQKAADLILRAKRVVVIGVGLSKIAAEYFSKLLLQSGKESSYVYDSHILTLLPGTLTAEDLVIIISASGKTTTILSVAQQLHYSNIATIALTNVLDTPLQHYTNFSFSTGIPRQLYNGFDISPRSLILTILDIIFDTYLLKITS
ncbi:MAG: MurR/RpiR family transcriptional regulator [Culicoidibacterales bacterium]